MKKYRRFAIPLIAYILSALCAFAVSSWHRDRIAGLVNLAGSMEWPIALVSNTHGVWLSTLENHNVYIRPKSKVFPYFSFNGFTPDGRYEDRILLWNLRGPRIVSLTFPDFNYKLTGLALESPSIDGAMELTEYDWNSWSWYLIEEEGKIYAKDELSGYGYELNLPDQLVLPVPSEYTNQYGVNYVRDGSAVYIKDRRPIDFCYLIRLDLETNEFIQIEGDIETLLSSTYGGNYMFAIVGNPATSVKELTAFNGKTLEKLTVLPMSNRVRAWEGWLAIIDDSTSELVFFDIQNQFSEHRQPIPHLNFIPAFKYTNIALYEPPLNGLDGMNENYIPED